MEHFETISGKLSKIFYNILRKHWENLKFFDSATQILNVCWENVCKILCKIWKNCESILGQLPVKCDVRYKKLSGKFEKSFKNFKSKFRKRMRKSYWNIFLNFRQNYALKNFFYFPKMESFLMLVKIFLNIIRGTVKRFSRVFFFTCPGSSDTKLVLLCEVYKKFIAINDVYCM